MCSKKKSPIGFKYQECVLGNEVLFIPDSLHRVRNAKNIAFDCSGVLIPKRKELKVAGPIIQKNLLGIITRREEVDEEKALRIMGELLRHHNKESVHHAVMAEYRMPLPEYASLVYNSEAMSALKRDIRPNPELHDALKSLELEKAILSNGLAIYVKNGIRFAAISSQFNQSYVVSCERLGESAKPEKKAYRLFSDFTDFDPKETIFVDNKRSNLEPAAELGFITWYVGNEEIKKKNIDFSTSTAIRAISLINEIRRN